MKKIKNTEIVDTFAEAFEMWASRLIVTAESEEWALAAAKSATGFATSVIGCKCEAGIEKLLKQEETPDNRYGVSILIFTMDPKSLEKRLTERIGQSIMTCPTTSCFNGLDSKDSVNVGGQLKYFGDGYQIRKSLLGRRFWRIPVMDGEFIVDEKFNIQPAVGGGNIILLAKDQESALVSAQAAVKAMQSLPNIILPFPNGVVRSGSKVGSKKYKRNYIRTGLGYGIFYKDYELTLNCGIKDISIGEKYSFDVIKDYNMKYTYGVLIKINRISFSFSGYQSFIPMPAFNSYNGTISIGI